MRRARALRLGLLALTALTAACAVPSHARLPIASFFSLEQPLDGRILFVKEGDIWAWGDGRARPLTTGGTWRQPQWSPDGSEIAYVYRSTNFSEIFVMKPDGSNNRRLTSSQSSLLDENDWVFRPTWSPSGAIIAYVSDSDTHNPAVWLMNKDGSGKKRLLGTSALQEAADALSWSPDGNRLAVTAFGQELSQILLMDVARGSAQQVTESPRGALDPAWSPDGERLAYAVRENGRVEVRVRRLDGTAETTVSQGGFARSPAWSPDGRQLAYISSLGGSFELHVVDVVVDGTRLSGRNDRQLTRDLNVDAASGLSWGR